MVRLTVLGAVLALTASSSPVLAHQSPFTYLDIRLQAGTLELSLVAHAFDVAHDVGLEKPEQIFDEAILRERVPRLAALLAERMTFRVDGQAVPAEPWTIAEPLPAQQSIRFTSRVSITGPPGVVDVAAQLFPYDPVHQTFVNFQEHDVVSSQTILDLTTREARYYAGSTSGVWAAIRALTVRGFVHILTGPEHVAMLVGLLLLGGSKRKHVTIALAFVAGHVITLALATFTLIGPPARLIDPAVALAIVYIGTDNLMSSGGRDVRTWMSFGVGALHGFGFVAVLRAMALSRPALIWSLLAANAGMAAAQLGVAALIGVTIDRLGRRFHGAVGASTAPSNSVHRVAVFGSVVVMTAGAMWFVQRVFFPSAAFPGLMARL